TGSSEPSTPCCPIPSTHRGRAETMDASLPQSEVVLWGVGHTHAIVLRMWWMRPIAGARLTCVTDFPIATYSGMLPGVLAGQYPRDRMEIDLVQLCAAAGARLIVGNVH